MFDYIIIGAGIYGLYAASYLGRRGAKVLVVDCEQEPFCRGSYINQARLHNGYHYPRSTSTAMKSAHYFDRFMSDFGDCIYTEFDQIYAIARDFSWTNSQQFAQFSQNLDLKCEEIDKRKYFNSQTIEKAFLTHEFTFDAKQISKKLYQEVVSLGVSFRMGQYIKSIKSQGAFYYLTLDNGESLQTPFLINASYAGTNQIHQLLGFEALKIKYELCEVILCNVSSNIRQVGLTVMDGPFFSIMPFGHTGYHSLTTVSRTPHMTSYDALPTFQCQYRNRECTPMRIHNCSTCNNHPASAFAEMWQTAKKYIQADIKVEPVQSLFTLKPILKASEIDDSRPTIIRQYSEHPHFYTVFSGKINTMYDLDEILQ